jgi:type I restriction enzyme S subunit
MSEQAFRDSGQAWLGDIPIHWQLHKLGAHFTERNVTVNDTDYPALSVTMQGIVPQLETAAKSDANDKRKQVLKGDFVINSRSDRKGSSGISPFDGSVSQIAIVLEPKDIAPGYAHYLLRSYPFQEEFYKWGSGIVADLWSTRFSAMKQILIPVPPSAEQDAIVDFLEGELSQIDALIRAQESFRSLLDERDHSTRLQVLETIWPIVRFGRVVSQVLVSSESERGVGLDALESWTGKIIVENLQTNVSGTTFKVGDVLFGRLRPYLAKAAAPEFAGSALGDVLVFRSELLDAGFLSLLMRTRSFVDLCTGASYGTKMPRVNWETIRQFEFPLPPIDVQRSLAEKVSVELAKSRLLRSKSLALSDQLTIRRTSLVAAAVTGKNLLGARK